MRGKTALVLGASTGIGRMTALLFAARGAKVVLASRDVQKNEAAVSEITANGGEARCCRCDVRNPDEIEAAVAHAVTEFGGLDVAVNSAGIGGAGLPITEQTIDSYSETFDINVRGTMFAMKYEMLAMRSKGGSIVNISSTMAFRGRPNLAVYCASKHAVEGLTMVGAIEGAAFGVRVNAIAPGPIQTPMLEVAAANIPGGKEQIAAGIPLNRIGRAEEAAALIAFLASDEASYVTGQSVAVDGGRLAL